MRPTPGPLSRWTAVAVATIVGLYLLGGALFYRSQSKMMSARVERELDAIAALKAKQIAEWRRDHLEDAAAFQANRALTDAAARVLAEPTEASRAVLRAHLREIAREHQISEILLLDPGGRERLSRSPSAPVWDGLTGPLTTALRTRLPVFVDLHSSEHRMQPHVAVIAPLFDGGGAGRRALGALVFLIDAAEYLFPVV